ncbi:ribonuclease H-like protein [Meredithblackwellia eburnea MCA 4105]
MPSRNRNNRQRTPSAYEHELIQKAVNNDGETEISRRRWLWCPYLARRTTDDLLMDCDNCGRTYLRCCQCTHLHGEENVAHHQLVLYVDGACSSNGLQSAIGGIGGGTGEESFSFRLEDGFNGQALTSQRSELLAALYMLCVEAPRFLAEEEEDDHRISDDDDRRPQWIVVADSEYVVKGITEWYPNWKRKGWKTSSGSTPSNLDLFHKLDDILSKHESNGISIGFWHVARQYNTMADRLAKQGKEIDDPSRTLRASEWWFTLGKSGKLARETGSSYNHFEM